VAYNLAAQQQEDHEVYLISRATRNKEEFKNLKANLSYTLLPLNDRIISTMHRFDKYNVNIDWMLGNLLKRYQQKYNFDVWHLNLMGKWVLRAFPYIKAMGVPIVGTCHGIDIQKLPDINYGWRLNKAYEDKLTDALMQCDVITAISETVKNDYESLHLPSEKTMMVPNGINFDHIYQYQQDKTVLRKLLGLPEDKKIIITVGRNHPKKGYHFIPEIIQHIVQKRKDILWVIVGRNTEKIGKIAQEMGVDAYLKTIPAIGMGKENDNEKYLVPSNEIISLYKAANVFAFPTLIESFGLVNIEAMAAELPVIVTDAPGCNDLVTHRYNGLVSAVGDNQGMAENILEVLDNEQLSNRLIKNGVEVAKKHDWGNVAQQYVQSYKQAIASKRKTLVI
jgi:glycosyltransferase involved in cell wall biosynthesis